MPTAPNLNDALSDHIKKLPGLLVKLESALAPKADRKAQEEAFGRGCSLLKNLIESIKPYQSNIDHVMEETIRYEISLLDDQFEKFITDEFTLLTTFGFSAQQLSGLKANFDLVKDELNPLRFDSKEVVAELEKFSNLLCELNNFASQAPIPDPKDLIQTCISGVIDVGAISADVFLGFSAVSAVSTGLLLPVMPALSTVLISISSVKGGYLSLKEKILPNLRKLFQRAKTRRKQQILSDQAPHRKLRRNPDDDAK